MHRSRRHPPRSGPAQTPPAPRFAAPAASTRVLDAARAARGAVWPRRHARWQLHCEDPSRLSRSRPPPPAPMPSWVPVWDGDPEVAACAGCAWRPCNACPRRVYKCVHAALHRGQTRDRARGVFDLPTLVRRGRLGTSTAGRRLRGISQQVTRRRMARTQCRRQWAATGGTRSAPVSRREGSVPRWRRDDRGTARAPPEHNMYTPTGISSRTNHNAREHQNTQKRAHCVRTRHLARTRRAAPQHFSARQPRAWVGTHAHAYASRASAAARGPGAARGDATKSSSSTSRVRQRPPSPGAAPAAASTNSATLRAAASPHHVTSCPTTSHPAHTSKHAAHSHHPTRHHAAAAHTGATPPPPPRAPIQCQAARTASPRVPRQRRRGTRGRPAPAAAGPARGRSPRRHRRPARRGCRAARCTRPRACRARRRGRATACPRGCTRGPTHPGAAKRHGSRHDCTHAQRHARTRTCLA